MQNKTVKNFILGSFLLLNTSSYGSLKQFTLQILPKVFAPKAIFHQKKVIPIKNNYSLEVMRFTGHEAKEEEILLLNKTFKKDGFDEHNYMKNYTWIRAHITTPSQVSLAGAAIYKKSYDNEVSLHFLVTAPDHQKKGVGAALINYIAETENGEGIRLWTAEEARQFYLGLGFEQQHHNWMYKPLKRTLAH